MRPSAPLPGPSVTDKPSSDDSQAFEVWRKRLGLVLTPVAFALTYYVCDGLSPEGRKLAAILAAVVVLWMSEVIPLPVTALLGAVSCIVLGAVPEEAGKTPAAVVFAHFADPIVFVFIGGFMLARAMAVHGTDRRIALAFLTVPWVGTSPARVMVGLGLVTACLSMWISNTAATAMMLPMALGMLRALHEVRLARGEARGALQAKDWSFATGMMLMVAYSASIGGIATPVGSPPNLIGIGLIRRTTGIEINFFSWMALAVPLFLVMGLALAILLYLLHPPDRVRDVPASHGEDEAGPRATLLDHIQSERGKLGPWTRGQVNTLIALGVAVVLWVMPGILQLPWFEGHWLGAWMGRHIPESVAGIVAAILLFVLPVDLARGRFTLTWSDAVKIDWGTILLFGGGLALGSLMFKTGVAEAMGQGLTSQLGVHSLWLLTGLAIAMAIVLSEAASNTASANMVIPVVIAIAQAAGVSPLPPALGAALGASFGFMLPVSTPPNAIVYGSGLIPLPRMMRAGILFDIMGFFIIWAGLYVLCPVLGFV